MRILKVCLKFPHFPSTLPMITLLDKSFSRSSSTWLRGVRGEKYKIVNFSHNFCHRLQFILSDTDVGQFGLSDADEVGFRSNDRCELTYVTQIQNVPSSNVILYYDLFFNTFCTYVPSLCQSFPLICRKCRIPENNNKNRNMGTKSVRRHFGTENRRDLGTLTPVAFDWLHELFLHITLIDLSETICCVTTSNNSKRKILRQFIYDLIIFFTQ